MYQAAAYRVSPPDYIQEYPRIVVSGKTSGNWQMLRTQLLAQWKHVTAPELDEVGPNHNRIARLIERKYGISAKLVEHYLQNFERTMPLAGTM